MTALALSVVVPCRNEASRIAATVHRLVASLENVDGVAGSFEVIVVDDSSTDGSPAVVAALAAADSRVRAVAAWPRRGKGAAVRTGILAAAGELVLVTDADLAGDPEQLPVLIESLSDAAAALGTRVHPASSVEPPRPWRRRLAAATFRTITSGATGIAAGDPQCGFKLFRRRAVLSHVEALETDGFAYEVELLLRLRNAGLRVVDVPIRWSEGATSQIRLVRDGARMAVDTVRLRRLAAAGVPPIRPPVRAVRRPLSVVLPVYQEIDVIESVVDDVMTHVVGCLGDNGPPATATDAEVILVDDRGTDGTSAVLARLATADHRLRLLVNERNLGHGPSVLRGLDAATGEWLLQLDSDGQLVLDDFAALWARRGDADLIVGVRADRHDPPHRLAVSACANALVSLLAGRRVTDANAGFKLVSAELYAHLRPHVPDLTFAPSLLLTVAAIRCGARVELVDVGHRARAQGVSSLHAAKLAGAVARSTAQTLLHAVAPLPPLRPPGAAGEVDARRAG